MRVAPGATGGLVGGGFDLPVTLGFGSGGGSLSAVGAGKGRVQSALLATGLGRAAARAAADDPLPPGGPPAAWDITGVPSGSESLVAGVPVSTPLGICEVCEGGGGRRGGGLAVCAATPIGRATRRHAAATRQDEGLMAFPASD